MGNWNDSPRERFAQPYHAKVRGARAPDRARDA